jgi:ferredoxin
MSQEITELALNDFARELTATSNTNLDISHCHGCASCSSACKVAIFGGLEDRLTPRAILYKAIIGERETLLSSAFIWLCSGCRRCEEACPQQVKISEVIRALRRFSFEMGNPNPLAARINERVCMHCGACASACPNGAIAIVEGGPKRRVARIDPAECRGCGGCSSVCPNGAAQQSTLNYIEVLDMFARR